MQCLLTFICDLGVLGQQHSCQGLDVRVSAEAWNPIASVRLRGLRLPPTVCPPEIDLQVPVPNLYGFAELAVPIVLFDEPIIERSTNLPVPFCRRMDAVDREKHAPYYVALRGAQEDNTDCYFLCLTPPIAQNGTIAPHSLCEFLETFLMFLREPTHSVRRELEDRKAQWESSPSPWLLARIGHLLEGLGEWEQALSVYRRGMEGYPARREFQSLLRQASRRHAILTCSSPDEAPAHQA